MTQPPRGYRLGKVIHSGWRSEIHEAIRESDGRALVLKLYVDATRSGAEARAQRELDALRRAAGPGVVAPIELVALDRGAGLILERAPGVPLARWVETALPAAEAFVDVAVQAVDALSRLHAARMIHRDIHPNNLLVDPATLGVVWIDFELARPLGAALRGETGMGSSGLAGSLPYMAPEATGRMNRGVDARSDLYALGATFYLALTGRPPFADRDALSLIHAHMARIPLPPRELNPHVPAALSRIIAKLLQKAPEDRYQTAHALHHDLVECRAQLERTGAIRDDFVLATTDVPHRPLFPKRIYGRDAEIARLREAYAQAATGAPSVLLLSGAPGMGKSELVNELRMALVETGGYLTLGKFDQYRPDVPYAGFARAFAALAQQILTESDARLERWRSELLAGLGGIAQALVNLVPELGLVLGDVPRVPALGPEETRQRLALAVRQLIRAAATREHPLALCLDDLQWADAASRELLRELVLQADDQALLVVGIYRDADVDRSHPLAALIRELEQHGVRMQTLQLRPLDEAASARMLADALGRTPEQTRTLAACVARKTGSAPLLIQQFIYRMYDLGLIRFVAGSGWSWDDAALASAEVPDDAVALLATRIASLPPQVAAVLQLASFAADVFDVEMLGERSERPHTEIQTALFALLDEGLVVPAEQGLRFVHDRIREAAQRLLSAAERARLHAQCASLLLARTAPEALPERALEIADHLLQAPAAADEAAQLRRIEVLVLAGRRALQTGAAATAWRYLDVARGEFGEAHWASHLERGFDLYMHTSLAARQNWDYDGALELLDALDRRPLSQIQSAQVAALRIGAITLARRSDALQLIVSTLRRFGIRSPTKTPSQLRVLFEIFWTLFTLRGPLDESTFPPPRMPDPSLYLAKVHVLRAVIPALVIQSRPHFALLISYLLRMYRREGQAAGLPMALASWGAMQLAFEKARRAERYAEAALAWLRRMPDPVEQARTEYLVYAMVRPLTSSRQSVVEPLRRTGEQLFELGEIEYGSYAMFLRESHMILGGVPLALIEDEHARDTVRLRGSRASADLLSAVADDALQMRVLRMLRAEGGVRSSEVGPALAALGAELAGHPGVHFGLSAIWSMVAVVLGHLEGVLAASSGPKNMLGPFVLDVLFFRGMVAASEASDAPGGERRRLGRVLRRSLRALESWARQNAELDHMARALRAEHARLRGRRADALALYARAAERAASGGYRHHAALLHERRAELLLSMQRPVEGASALQQALSLYDAWGASRKVEELRVRIAGLR